MTTTNDVALDSGIRRLRYEAIAPGRPYHAALSTTDGSRARGFKITEHTHDFYELMFVLAGEAVHGINGVTVPLHAHHLVFLRPDDRHFIRFRPERFLHYINIAFPAGVWQDFDRMTGLSADINFAARADPIMISLDETESDACAVVFRRALEKFQGNGLPRTAGRVEICHLLTTVAPMFLRAVQSVSHQDHSVRHDAPPWLTRACRILQNDPLALRDGLPRFVAEAGVTSTHLARVLRATLHQTPTEYVNGLRLDCASRLLATTTLPILDIASECGIDQPSYFYRLFRARFGASPHAYRVAAARRVAP